MQFLDKIVCLDNNIHNNIWKEHSIESVVRKKNIHASSWTACSGVPAPNVKRLDVAVD